MRGPRERRWRRLLIRRSLAGRAEKQNDQEIAETASEERYSDEFARWKPEQTRRFKILVSMGMTRIL
jgi:hypothetical protein